MTNFLRTLTLVATIGIMAVPTFAQDDSPFTDGTVYRLTTVRTGANSQDAYLKQLSQFWYPSMVKAKQMGLIKDFHILAGQATNQADYDILMIVEFENMASMDPSPEREAKWKVLREEVKTSAGGQEKLDAFDAALNTNREMLGTKFMRDQLLK